jgi:hypothetical protein
VSKVFKVPSDLKAFKESKVTSVHKVLPESKGFREPLDQSDPWVRKETLDHKAFKVLRVFKVPLVSKVSKAFREIPEPKAPRVFRE